ncbi:DUF2306 domain-containing protein [Occallatibacter riparius]|uniref:DUF2306 domain-containing protein n=1 Tax=Occallatibacter riparius TaxID=1002689 RepID=A0A9J7BR41_9BACT|nr:DUF2306 domain-containing protein [Occallatibacter riparius]UWZ83549.1 DUF2306 domain-containing protein [Occallatibacter riparius]
MKRILRVGFWVCTAIAVLVVVRRLMALGTGEGATSRAPELANLDASFASHMALTLAHIIPALLFVLIVPVVMFGRGRLANVLERVLYPLGMIVGVTAYAMSAFAVGGWVERAAVLTFNTWFLWCLARAWRLAGSGDVELQRRWLLRGIATLLGIATTRPVMGMFFATSRLTHWQPAQFFGYAFWIGFSINVVLIEVYVRRRVHAFAA